MMLQYVRGAKKRKVGVLVALLNDDGKIVIGHSKWHKKLDKYDIELGRKVAIDRAEKDSAAAPAVSLREDYCKFMLRTRRYFKDTELSVNTLESYQRLLANAEAVAAKQMAAKRAAAETVVR
jgi:hypothetical protein